MKPNDPYWQERFESLEVSRHDKSVEKVREVVRNLSNAEKEIISDIEMWYGRYAGEQGVSYAEAKKRLTAAELRRFKMSVEEYIRKASDFVEAETWQKQLKEMSARVHVARLQSLLIQVQAAVEAAYQSINAEITSYLADALQDEYFRAAYELQVGVGYGVSVAALDTKTIESILEKAWAADGVNFSGRIWQERATLVNKVAQIISQGVARGIGAKEMAQQLDDVTEQVSAAIKTRMSNCERLILTETAFFQEDAHFRAFKEMDVDSYELVATLDSRTSEICREMDGKTFKLSDRQIGVTAPPFHPRCRTTTIPFISFGKRSAMRAARNADGKSVEVPSSMTYREWAERFAER